MTVSAVEEMRKLENETEKELVTLFHTTMAEVAKGAIERSRDSAKYVQTAAAAVNALYVAVLGLVFSVTDHPLPIRGLYPTLFLAAAVAMSTAYLAYLTTTTAPPLWAYGTSRAANQLARTSWLVAWVNATVMRRRYLIRASVLALAAGVLLIPAPFVTLSGTPSVPDLPAFPAVPEAVAPEVRDKAVALFEAQVSDYEAVVAARKKALDAAPESHETGLNQAFALLALLGAVFVFLGPLSWRSLRKPRST